MISRIWGLWSWLHPSIDALFARDITFSERWRMLLLLQPITYMTYALTCSPWLFSRAFTTEYITVDTGRMFRILVFKAKDNTSKPSHDKLRPLHLDVHGGAFMGGKPESDARFCDLLARTTGAVVISATYRFAPAHRFPAAIDDIDAVVRFLQANAAQRWAADPALITVSGFSAGGNLVFAATQQPACHAPAPTAIKAAVTFFAVVDLRLPPQEKPRPLDAKGNDRSPKNDPMAALIPLMDSYAVRARKDHMNDARLSPILAKLETLPKDILLIVPAIDIAVHEQLTFVERIKAEIEADPNVKGKGRRAEAVVYENAFHGWTYGEYFDNFTENC